MSESWENELVRKKDLIDWLQKTVSTSKDLQYLYRDRIDYTREIAVLNALADSIRLMKPYDSNDISYRGTRMYGERLGESNGE